MRRTFRQLSGALVTAAVVPALALGAGHVAADSTGHPSKEQSTSVVRTESGPVRGSTEAGADRFLGLPYAAPPVRELRFAPPAA